MEGQKNRLKDGFLTYEVIVQPAQGYIGFLCDLAHGRAMITLFNKKVMCCLQYGDTRLFSATRSWKGHNNPLSINKTNVRSYFIQLKLLCQAGNKNIPRAVSLWDV